MHATTRRLPIITWLAVAMFITPVATANSLSKIGDAAREDARKLVSGLEVTLQAAVRKQAWVEALELVKTIRRVDPRNPQAESAAKPAVDAFLAETIGKRGSSESKALNRLRTNYLDDLSDLLVDARKKNDVLAVRECATLLLETQSGDEALTALRDRADAAAKALDPDALDVSKRQEAARRARSRYLAALNRALKRYESQGNDLATLDAARKILEIDPTSGDASRAVEGVSWKVHDVVLAKARKNRERMPYLRKAEATLESYAAKTRKRLDAARAAKDPLGVLQCAKYLLALDPEDKEVAEAQRETREQIVKTARALGRAINEEDLEWYKIEGKYAFDGDRVAFNTGVLGIGPMARDVVVVAEIKAADLRLAYGWGADKKWGSGGTETHPNFDGRQWVPVAVIATPHVGYWQIGDKVYRDDGCEFTGRLIIYPEGQVEVRRVRVFDLIK